MASANGKDITTKLATQEKPKMTVAQFFESQIPNIQAVLPRGTMDAQRMARLAIQIWTGNSKLASCNKESFVAALITCAQFGLEPNTPLGQCYIIPYGNQATFQMGYQGLLNLAYRSGEFKSIYVREVYKNDEFKVTYGIFEDLQHVPSDDGPEDKELPVAIYAVYHLKNGGYNFEAWTWNKIIKHAKKFSQSYTKKDGAWQTNPVAMGKKTVLIALLKYAPKSLEMAQAMEVDNTAQADVGSKREYIDLGGGEYTVANEETKPSGNGPSNSEENKNPDGQSPSLDTALDFEQAMNNGQSQV